MREQHLFGLIAAWLLPGCLFFGGGQDAGGCPEGARCDSSELLGPTHGLRADGTVDIRAAEAWPKRAIETAPLSAVELAQACSVLGACIPADPAQPGQLDPRALVTSLCADPNGSYFWEERAVPTLSKNERWSFEARAIIAAHGDCAVVNAIETARPNEIVCEEDGCWWASPEEPIPSVSCQGDVATLTTSDTTFTRDCSRALAKCDTGSPTGCTDRPPAACQQPAKDRCDGAIRIGCDGTGKVSFHDCSRVEGGTCGQVKDGLGCVYPNAGQCSNKGGSCSDTTLSLCVLGKTVDVDCKAMGLSGCSTGHCVANP